MSSWRLRALSLSFLLFGIVVISRLFYWQILEGEKLLAEAESQHFQVQEFPAPRGKIFSSDNFPLATNKEAYLLYAILSEIENVKGAAQKLARIFPSSEGLEEEFEKRLSRQDLAWVLLARKVDKEICDEIETLGLSGIGFEKEEKRFYPESSMSAHLLGFVGQDSAGRDQGYFGLEGFYDRELKGRPGILRQEKTASGKPILIGRKFEEEEIPGRDLILYLDRSIQYIVEGKLKDGLEKYGAKAGSVVIMDPETGGIIAMASFPNYDPTNYAQEDKNLFSNPIVSESFEPGSIFKVLIMSAAINENIVKPNDRCPVCTGPRVISGYTVKTWDEKYHPDSTMIEIIQHSDNVGMTYVGEKIGIDRFYDYLWRFGIGQKTGIDLEEEASSLLRPKEKWVDIDLATASFGQGIAITPIQMTQAVTAVANGGKLLEPHVVAKIKTRDKEIEVKPKVIREVINSTTAKIITEMMVNATEKGEAKWAKPKGFRIAGKTGTAQIPIAGHYDEEKTIASFVGFAPADNPKFVMLVTLREPTSSPWGSETAAPLWFDIAKEIFVRWGIQP